MEKIEGIQFLDFLKNRKYRGANKTKIIKDFESDKNITLSPNELTTITTVLNSNLYNYNGKYYSEGEVVPIKREPIFKRKRPEKDTRTQLEKYLQKQHQKHLNIGQEFVGEAEAEFREKEDQNGEDDDETMQGLGGAFDVESGKGKKTISSVKGLEFDEDEDEEGQEEYGNVKPGTWQEIIDFEEKIQKRKIKYGIEIEIEEYALVPTKKPFKVGSYIALHKGADNYVVAKDKKGKLYLKPQTFERNEVLDVFDADTLPPPVPTKYKHKPTAHKQAPTTVKDINIGDCISFSIIDNSIERTKNIRDVYGKIKDYAPKDQGFLVKIYSSEGDPNIPTIIEVPFDEPTLRKEMCPGKKYVKIIDVVPSEYYGMEITEKVRKESARSLFVLLSNIIPDMFERTNLQLENLRSKIDWELVKLNKPDWDTYYAREFRNWLVATKLYPRFKEESYLHLNDFHFQSIDIYNNLRFVDPFKVISEMMVTYGNDLFNYSGAEVLQKMKTIDDEDPTFIPSNLYLFIEKELKKVNIHDLERLKGQNLALTISNLISSFYNSVGSPPPPKVIAFDLQESYIRSKIVNYNPSTDDENEFGDAYPLELQIRFGEFELMWENEQRKLQEYKNLKNTEKLSKKDISLGLSQNVEDPFNFKETVNGKKLSELGTYLISDVVILEGKIYTETYPKPLFYYLKRISELLIFLDTNSDIGKECNFFHSKIKIGMYRVKNLNEASYYHMFPELFIPAVPSRELTEKEKESHIRKYSAPLKKLDVTVSLKIDECISFWIMEKGITTTEIPFHWGGYIIKVCKTAKRLKLDTFGGPKDIKNYKCTKEKLTNKIICKANIQFEDIPIDDLIVCYSPEKDVFSCLSLTDIIYALKEENEGKVPINYLTNTPFTQDFLKRMRFRYENEIDSPQFRGLPERVMEFEFEEEKLNPPQDVSAKKAELLEPITKISPTKSTKSKKKKVENLQPTTLKEAFKGLKSKQKLVILFRYKYTKPTEYKKAYEPFIESNKIKLIEIIKDDETIPELQKNMKIKGDPVWVVYAKKPVKGEKKTKPKIVFLEDIDKKNTVGISLKNILK